MKKQDVDSEWEADTLLTFEINSKEWYCTPEQKMKHD